eukprot:3096507-Rhodomonas_salina.3
MSGISFSNIESPRSAPCQNLSGANPQPRVWTFRSRLCPTHTWSTTTSKTSMAPTPLTLITFFHVAFNYLASCVSPLSGVRFVA